MAFVHGKNTYISIGGVDLSAFTKTSNLKRGADKHDITTYTKNDHVFFGGLGIGDGGATFVYDNTTAGPRDTIEPLIGTLATIVIRPEGTGSGLPQDSFSALIEEFETTNPVDDMVMCAVKWTVSDAVTSTNQ